MTDFIIDGEENSHCSYLLTVRVQAWTMLLWSK